MGIFSILLGALGGFLVGLFLNYLTMRKRLRLAQEKAREIIEKAEKEVESHRKSQELRIKEEWYKEKLRFEKETAAQRKELQKLERRLSEKELSLSKKDHLLSTKEEELLRKQKELGIKERIIKTKTERLDQLINEENQRLLRITGLSKEEAKKELMKNLESEARLEATKIMKEIRERAQTEAEKKAREIIIQAIQRCNLSHWAETTVSTVMLPSDEMKGRIIGREGRNIRTFETLTGAEVIIDDTPGVILISAFDPIRREIAKISMERLVSDGRIHPGRIEEIVNKTRYEMDDIIKEAGEAVVLELGIVGLHPEIIKLLGKLKYRTSYGQNVLLHSKEVAYLAAHMAAELDLDPAIAKRAGLLHDIGKAADKSMEGPHAKVGAELARRYGEPEEIVNAIASHHEEVPLTNPYSFLVLAADAISGGRPGARRESFETYIKRLEELENLATGFPGVEKAYAIQAGREVRVLVEPNKISDEEASDLAIRIASRIESELKYPGEIKVVVIRETRAVGYAH